MGERRSVGQAHTALRGWARPTRQRRKAVKQQSERIETEGPRFEIALEADGRKPGPGLEKSRPRKGKLGVGEKSGNW